MKKLKPKLVTSPQAILLFRRKCAPKPPTDFLQGLVADATRRALQLLGRVDLEHVQNLHTVYGLERTFDEKGNATGRAPRYGWVRIETVVLSEGSRIPKRFTRAANGMLKALHI